MTLRPDPLVSGADAEPPSDRRDAYSNDRLRWTWWRWRSRWRWSRWRRALRPWWWWQRRQRRQRQRRQRQPRQGQQVLPLGPHHLQLRCSGASYRTRRQHCEADAKVDCYWHPCSSKGRTRKCTNQGLGPDSLLRAACLPSACCANAQRRATWRSRMRVHIECRRCRVVETASAALGSRWAAVAHDARGWHAV